MQCRRKSQRVLAALLLATAAFAADTAEWQVEMVDRAGTGVFSSLKLDAEGNAHLAYVIDDGRRSPLKYAFWDHALGRWFVMEVAEGAAFASLALDSQNHPHISYVDSQKTGGAKLRYAHWDGKAWKTEALPLTAENVTYYTSIVMDSHDHPVIAFCEESGPPGSGFKARLRVMMWSSDHWTVQTVDADRGSGIFNSMAIDANGGIHLAYGSASDGGSLRYAFWNGEWTVDRIDGAGPKGAYPVGESVAIALDRQGNPRITYISSARGVVKLAERRDGQWDVQAVDRLPGAAGGDRNSIAVDDDGRVYLGYFDAKRGSLKVTHREGGQWVSEVVDSNEVGFTSSLQIRGGTLWVSYADLSNRVMKVARRKLQPAKGPEISEKPGKASLAKGQQ
jgi:hypothetical protein